MKQLLLIISLTISHAAVAEWERTTANTLLVADWLQTRDIATNDNYREVNPILGAHPSIKEVDTYFALSIFGTNLVGEYLLPEQHKHVWYKAISILQVTVVARNIRIGVKFKL